MEKESEDQGPIWGCSSQNRSRSQAEVQGTDENPTAYLLLDPSAVFGDTGIHARIMYFSARPFPRITPSKNPSALDFTSLNGPQNPLGKEKEVMEAPGPAGAQGTGGPRMPHPLSSAWKLVSILEDLTSWNLPSLLS